MNIGKIIKSSSHLNYKCRIYGKNETRVDITEKDFHFGQFVIIKAFHDKEFIGIIYNSELYNPDYGNFVPRLTNPSDLNYVSIPDFIDETAIIVDIILVGWSENNLTRQETPPWVIPLNAEVAVMSEKEICKFHQDESNRFCMKYYNCILSHTGNFAPQLLLKIIDDLEKITECNQHDKLKLLKQHILWQQTNVKLKV